MTLKPSTAFSGLLTTATFTAGAANADSLPTAALYQNGVLDAGVTVTVTNLAAGIYKLTGTLGAYSAGDEIQLRATAVMGGLTFNEVIWDATIDSKLTSDLNDATAAPSAAAVASQVRTELTTELGRVDVAVSSRNATTPPTAAAIRTEMDSNSTKLANLDVAVSTRAEAVSAGSGAYQITVTVTDGTDPLEGAKVRVIEGATNIMLTTDAAGNATFALDAATYSVAVTKPGYSFTPTTRTVTGEEAGTLTADLAMTQRTLPAAPADPDLCTVYFDTEDFVGEVLVGETITLELLSPKPATSAEGRVVSGAAKTMVDAGDGRYTKPLERLFQYRARNTDLFGPGGLTFTVPATGDNYTPIA